MKTKIIISTEKELKVFVNENRANIMNINNINFNKLYPLIEVSNKHASYYNVESQENKFLHAPFNVIYKS